MAVYALGDREPEIHPGSFVHPEAVVIGSATLKGARIDKDEGAVIAAGAVVSPSHVPARRMALGVPARIRADREVPEDGMVSAGETYVAVATWHRAEPQWLS
ncbi:MAG: hypothetical protein JO100_05810 [Pseudonocardia sp.]|nr:hypothetical protein [Pseudonocardia sp.]